MVKRFEQSFQLVVAPEMKISASSSLQAILHTIPTSRPDEKTAQELGVTAEMLAAPRKPFQKATQGDFERVAAEISNR